MILADTRGPWLGWLLSGSLLLIIGGTAIGLLLEAERRRPASVRAAELSYLPKGEYLKVAALGYRQMVADLIWLRAVQHLGERKQSAQGYLWAYHAVDVVTDLDPKFAFAYQAAGVVLGVWAGLPHESVAILSKGMRHNPEVWQLPFYAGYDYFYELHDPATAAKYFRIASSLPGSPEYLPKLAARMTVEAGDPDAAMEFLERMYQSTQDQRVREGLAWRIKEVIVERDIRFLEEGVRRYRTQYGKLPLKLGDLVSGNIILQIPPEPFGGRYQLNAAEGTVTSTEVSGRLRVHRK
ncbi:MAG: tetratricopeptide repeat protein [Nitrospiraceae bacterium]